jgi:glycerophosphoryl diester phosphodiesterase
MPTALPPFYAHRFGRAYGPDSSLRALEHARGEPLAGIETDCCLTADGAIALLHEPYLPHGCTAEGWAHERSARELAGARLRDAHGRPTRERVLLLEELLDRVADSDLTVQLEVKAWADADLAVRTAEVVCRRALEHPRARRERLEVISFWPQAAAVAAGHGLASRIIVACAYTPGALARWAAAAGVSGVILEGPYWAPEPVAAWRAAGLSVMSGVVNDPALLRRVLPFGPDAVATDRPHELRRELTEPA